MKNVSGSGAGERSAGERCYLTIYADGTLGDDAGLNTPELSETLYILPEASESAEQSLQPAGRLGDAGAGAVGAPVPQATPVIRRTRAAALPVSESEAPGLMHLTDLVAWGDPRLIARELADSTSPDLRDAEDLYGRTPLGVAAELGRVPIVRQLLDAGAAPDRVGSRCRLAQVVLRALGKD